MINHVSPRSEIILELLAVIAAAGLKFAVGIIPFWYVRGYGRFLETCDEVGPEKLGITLDTGHAWACGEIMPLIPLDLRGRISGTHLGDSNCGGPVKRSLCKGEIDWWSFLINLWAAGHTSRPDIKIVCTPGRGSSEYMESPNISRPTR